MRLREKLEKENEREMTKEWGQRTSLKKNPFKRYLSLLLKVGNEVPVQQDKVIIITFFHSNKKKSRYGISVK